jgi:carboxylate-amine ligase
MSDPAAMSAFARGSEFTVGVEEELMLVDDSGAMLGTRAAPLVDSLRSSDDRGVITGELYVDQVELNTPVCADAEEVLHSLRSLRATVSARGARMLAAGVHPTAALGDVPMVSSPRYDLIRDEYAGLFRTPTAAVQVHVGVPDEDTAMLAYRGLRNRMSVLNALAAGSPYWHGIDSGLASARSAILRSYPRTTVPPLLRSWEEYAVRTQALVAAAEVPDHTYVWWDLRPRPPLGTLEVRVMDAVPALSVVAGLTALVQGLARWAVEQPDPTDLSDDVLAVNGHRATRYGLDARITDVDGTMRPVREVAVRSLAEARTILAGDRLDAPLDAVAALLARAAEPDRQRGVVARDGMTALLSDLVARTMDLDG